METDDYDEIAVSLVVEDGYRMPLRGADRLEAIRRMAQRGMTQREAAYRLNVHPKQLRQIGKPHGIVWPRRNSHGSTGIQSS